MSAGDGTSWSEPSGWCEFTVDVTVPERPTVTGDVYKPTGCPGAGCGGIGVEGTFTFTSSPDVVTYRWGFTDPPTSRVPAGTPVKWTPTSGGVKVLHVEAIDRAGLSSRTVYEFIVAEPSPIVGQCLVEDATTDMTGNGRDLSVTGTITEEPGRQAGGLPTYGFATGSGSTVKILDTKADFTVAAWVRLADGLVDSTAVSQQGSSTSAFKLGYDAASSKWTFSLAENDTTDTVRRAALSDTNAAPGVWTQLVGVRDAGKVRLYVDGVLQQSTDVVTAGFDAQGGVTVGTTWQGALSDVRLAARDHAEQTERTRRTGRGGPLAAG